MSNSNCGIKNIQNPIVDAHVHVWASDIKSYPLAEGVGKNDLWRPSFTPEQHYIYSKSVGNVRFNLVQMTWYGTDHSYILDLISKDPNTFSGTGIIELSNPNPSKRMIDLYEKGCYAFREPTDSWDHPTMHDLFLTGGNNNLALSFNMGVEKLPELDKMAKKYPDTPIILDHVCHVGITNPHYSESEIEPLLRFAKHKNAMVKIGPFQALGKREAPYFDILPLLKRVIEAYGPKRCMWESDSGGPVWMSNPEVEYSDAVNLIKQHADFLTEEDKDYVLFKTAEKIFFNRSIP